ncbi:MAG: orotate phosphoribosyltransferase [Mycoplasmatales bacterium]
MKTEIINQIMEIGAIQISPNDLFTWTSGIKSPIYTDNRQIIGDVKLRKLVASELAKLVSEKFPDANLIGACATAGIPHGTSVADKLDLPLVYFRSKPKDHGTKSLIEGKFTKGQKVVIVEDLISTGKSINQAIDEARRLELEVVGGISIFSYSLNKSKTSFAERNVEVVSLIVAEDLLKNLASKFTEAEVNVVRDFLKGLDN